MKKRAKKLSLCTETLRTLSEPALARAAGGMVMTGDPTDCICPGRQLVDAGVVMTGDPTDCICPRPDGLRVRVFGKPRF